MIILFDTQLSVTSLEKLKVRWLHCKTTDGSFLVVRKQSFVYHLS